MVAWEKVEVPPSGHFIGWGRKEGQHVTGEVVEYDETGGTDFGGKVCPQIEVLLTERAASFNKAGDRTNYEPGERVVITCGSYELKRAIPAADPHVGDMIKVVMDGEDDLPNGNTVKRFSLQVARGGGDTGAKAKRERPVKAVPEPAATEVADDDEIPF